MDRITELLDGLRETSAGQTASGILADHASRSQAYADFRTRYPTPSDFGAWAARQVAPNIAGLLSGQPALPMENFPAEPGTHGSPYDFERFDLSKIGTGEGAQAYGHGSFRDDIIDILRKYGITGLPAGGLLGMMANQQPPQPQQQ
jgi:hypothetical protein